MSQEHGMLFCPRWGIKDDSLFKNCRYTAEVYRRMWPGQTWLYNPWTGKKRPEKQVKDDPQGLKLRSMAETAEKLPESIALLKNQSGFTTIELIIAIFVVTIFAIAAVMFIGGGIIGWHFLQKYW